MTLPVDPQRFALYLAVVVVLVATPGPANLFSIANGAVGGARGVLAGVAGMNAASLVWYAVSALGLGALILAFPAVFRLMAYAGAAYLGWLGLRSLMAALRDRPGLAHAPIRAGGSPFANGFAVQITNPKALIYFSAVLPPFLDAHRPLVGQLLVFGVASTILDVTAMTAYGLGGVALAGRMQEPRFRRAFAGLVGVLLLIAGVLVFARG